MSKKLFQKLLILYVMAILAVSTIPGGAIPKINIWSFDKVLHIIEYFIFAFLAINAITKPSKQTIVLIILGGFVYGGLNEIWQSVIANRYGSIYDAIANGIGMILGSIVTLKFLIIAHD